MSAPPGCCFICCNTLEEGKVVVVKKRGICSLIEVSEKRGLLLNKRFLQALDEVSVHDACRKRYTVESNVAASVRRGGDEAPQPSSSVGTRRSSESCNLDKICFLCGDEITDEFLKLQKKLPLSRRNIVHTVESLSVRETILEAAGRRRDEWAQQIIYRLASVNDLVAADARYHSQCRLKLYKPPSTTTLKRGHFEPKNITESMECIYTFLAENKEECQFSLSDLMNQIKGDFKPDLRTVKSHLEKHFGDKIMFSDLGCGRNHHTVLCFRDVGNKILYDNWYNERRSNTGEERLRVVKAAAEILVQDIRSVVYDVTEYPPSDNFLQNADSGIPESLKLMLETIVLKNKRKALEDWKKKCVGFAHLLISAVRPTSFVSSLKTSFGTYLYRKFGSKHLINLCSAMGFSCSYSEAVRIESSAIVCGESLPPLGEGSFMQFTFDNADVNVNTLDGENTFHEMGGIMIITPYSAVLPGKNIPRLKNYVSADKIASYDLPEVKQCNVRKNAGLSTIPITDVHEKFQVAGEILPSPPDLLWLYGKSSHTAQIPGWNGFMEKVTENLEFNRSKIVFLPFILAPPTDYDTIMTALLEASQKSRAHSQKTCFVTFDQPLYMKARDIVQSCPHPELSNVVVRLGGFHLLMSYMGSIGAIMAGSGLKELLCTIYAENSVDKILNGHAYSRAVRAHMLINLALAHLIFTDEVQLTEAEQGEMDRILNDSDRSSILLIKDTDIFQIVIAKFKTTLNNMEANGPTSKLWVQYFRMTVLMKQFIEAERMGDWELHLTTIGKMLAFFHSAGHFFYAKSARLYLQDMEGLEERMDPKEYSIFTKGAFTVRRSDKLWSGLWSDLTIEQVLMRSMKSQGGLTHGRGISNSVLSRWTGGMVFMLNICESLERFWDISCTTSEQHVDMRATQIERDTSDVEKLKQYLDIHPPFPRTNKLLSISSGVVGALEINCHMAREMGIEGVKKITGNSFGKVSFKKKDKVRTLESMSNSIKLRDKRVNIEPLAIFQRLCIIKQSDNELKEHFKYELAPYPMALFTEEGMRKGTKSKFYSAFTPLPQNIAVETNTFVVIDGGYLLHKVIWHRNDTVRGIVAGYVNYTFNQFGRNVAVVFDGYPENGAEKNTKTAERVRRYGTLQCNEVIFEESTVIKMAQEKLLANDSNKRRLIAMICSAFQSQGIETDQAVEDADCKIVKVALEKSTSFQSVLIVGEDVDLLVLLNGLGSVQKNVFFQKSSRGDSGPLQYSSTSFNRGVLEVPPGFELFLHAFTGCDTTSALFWYGKNKLWSAIQKHPELITTAEVFLQPTSTHQAISDAGAKCLVALYGGKYTEDTLQSLRFKTFVKTAASSKVDLARLPPTEDGATFHAYRTYHQVQMWMGMEKDATQWGWKKTDQGLIPITMMSEVAPPSLLKFLSCGCKKGCIGGGCTCFKAGLKCSALCKFCSGVSCQNVAVIHIADGEDDDDPLPIFQDESDDFEPPTKRTK